MSSSPDNFTQSSAKEEKGGFKSHLILPGILIISLFGGVYLGINWWFAHSELRIVKQELKSTRAALKEAQLRVEADQVIIRRQLEMLRTAQQPAPQSAP